MEWISALAAIQLQHQQSEWTIHDPIQASDIIQSNSAVMRPIYSGSPTAYLITCTRHICSKTLRTLSQFFWNGCECSSQGADLFFFVPTKQPMKNTVPA